MGKLPFPKKWKMEMAFPAKNGKWKWPFAIKMEMVSPSTEGELNPDPPNAKQHEAKQDEKTLSATVPFLSYQSLSSYFLLSVLERAKSLRCV